jgi:magnesium transporter
MYQFIVYRSTRNESQDSSQNLTLELNIFLGPNYLVTYHKESIAGVETIWDFCQQDQQYLTKGAGFLLYQIADEIAGVLIFLKRKKGFDNGWMHALPIQ